MKGSKLCGEVYFAKAITREGGVDSIQGVVTAPDPKSYVYFYRRTLSDLCEVDGLK